MIVYLYLLAPLLFLPAEASSIRSRNSKNELVPFESSEVDSPRRGDKWWMVDDEPFLMKLRTSTQSDAKQTKERDKKRKRPTKKRIFKGKHLKKHRMRRDLLEVKSKPIRQEKLNTEEDVQIDNGSDQLIKNLTKSTANRVEILRTLSSLSKKTENGHYKDEDVDGTQKGKNIRNHSKHRHPLSDHVKMTYPASPKPDRHPHKYTYRDLIADRKRLEQKINYIKNMLSVNDSAVDDPIRIRRRSESDKTANKIAKMFLTLSAVNGLHEKRKSKCRYGVEEDDGDDRVQDVWEKERKNSPTRKASSANEERYKVKKWIEFMKNKRSSGKTCPCMANVRKDDTDEFPLEQKLPKDYFLMERSRSSEESSESFGDPYYSRDKLIGQHKRRNKEDQEKSKGKNGKKKLELPLNDLELYRSRAKQILQNAEEILDKIKDEEERRLSAPNILMNHLKELTSRIQSDPRNNENDLIRKIQKNLGWNPLSKSKESPNGFVDNVKSYIIDPYEKAKALTDESAKMLSSYLLRNLGKMAESSEERQTDQDDQNNPQVYFGKIQMKEDEKPLAASLEKEADPLLKNKEELQNWEDTISSIMNGAEEAVKTDPDLANNREVFKSRMEDIIKEQQKKLTEFENSHQDSEEADEQIAKQQQDITSANEENPIERLDHKDEQTAKQQEEVQSANPSEGSEDEQTAKQQDFKTESKVPKEKEDQIAKQQELKSELPEEDKNGRIVQQEEVKSSNPSEGLEEEDEKTAKQRKFKSELPEEDNNDRIGQQEEVKSSNPSEGLEEDEKTANQQEFKSELPEEDKNDRIGQQEEVQSANISEDEEDEQTGNQHELKAEELEENKEDLLSQQQEDVKSANPENEDLEEKEGEETLRQQEEVQSADPESENLSIQLGPVEKTDKEADENPLTADAHQSERVEKPKESETDTQEEQELGREILDEIMKKFDEDPVGNEREIEDPEENSKTVDEEEENEDRVAESPKTVSDLSPSHTADDYDLLEEAPETEGNLKESSDEKPEMEENLRKSANEQPETLLQDLLEMSEKSASEEKSAEENPESDDKEIVNLEKNQNSKETQEASQESENPETFLENVNPIEEDKRQEDQEDETEAKTADNPEIVESETVLEKEDDEPLEPTLKNAESLEDPEERETDDDTPLQAKQLEEESVEDSDETPLREALEDEETQMTENGDDKLLAKNDEANLEMEKDDTVLKETMKEDSDNEAEEVQKALEETSRENEEELEDEVALQEANPKDAENSSESTEEQRDDENLDEVYEKSLKSINPNVNSEENVEALNRQNEEDQDETLQKTAEPIEKLEDLNTDEKTEEEAAVDDQSEEVQETQQEQTDESDDKHSGEVLKAAFEDLNEEDLTDDELSLKSENPEEASVEEGETLKQALDEENQKSSDETQDEALRATLENDQDEKEDILEKTMSVENLDKAENLEDDVAAADPKESRNESLETDPEEDTQREVKTDENLEEELENLRSTNLQSQEQMDVFSSEEEPRADITENSNSQFRYLEDDTPIISAKYDEDSREESSKETLRQENLGENLILEENDESTLRQAKPSNRLKQAKLKVPKSIGQIMADLEGKDAIQNLNPDEIDHIIDKIDEAEQQNLPDVDCRKECACAEEIDTRSRNIGRYEIAKDFLHWMKDLQLNRVLSDD